MRCFIAFDVPDLVKDKLYNLQKELNDNNAKIKWVEKKNLHLTLKFIGNVDGNKIKETEDKLRKIKLKSFEVYLGGLGVFPNKDYMRVVFVELDPVDKVIELQKEIDSEMISLFPKDERFHSHITLGRVKIIKNKNSFLKRMNRMKIEGNFKIKEFKLFKSTLSRNGPTYEVLKTYSLE